MCERRWAGHGEEGEGHGDDGGRQNRQVEVGECGECQVIDNLKGKGSINL